MTTNEALHFERLGKHHDRIGFSCGVAALDDYLKRQAGQDERKNLAFVYAMTRPPDKRVLAYYTLSSTSVLVADLPERDQKAIPYGIAPAALIGRLAVCQSVKGQGYGKLVLIDALRRIARTDNLAIRAVVVDPKDRNATQFYEKFGFLELGNGQMFLPFKTIIGL